MLVDVSFDGVPLARGATARPEGNGWFVELEQPMPVGTRLDISGETAGRVRVARVVEGAGAGMWLVPADAKAIEAEPQAKAGPKPDKGDAKAEKVDAKAEKGDAKTDAKADAKADVKVDGKADAKVDAKADAKADVKAEAKGDDGDDEPEAAPAKQTNGAGRDRRKKPRKPSGA